MPDGAGIQSYFADLPLSFITNEGQTENGVLFHVKGAGHTIFFTSGEVVFSASQQLEDQSVGTSVVRLSFDGANPNPSIEGLGKLPGVANFFVGKDSSKWITGVSTYAEVIYRDLYPGIDMVYKGSQGRLKSEFVIAPGTDPSTIRLVYSGVNAMSLRDDGSLVLQTDLGELLEAAPAVYQDIDGSRGGVVANYVLLGRQRVGFQLGNYDLAYPLVIDPVIEYSTYLGGSGQDFGNDIAVDTLGSVYVIGDTKSIDFPLSGPFQSLLNGSQDAYITKVDPSGTTLVYSTYLGGSDDDVGLGIAVDDDGNAYVTGGTPSADFPTVNAFETSGANSNTFVAKLSADGSSLVYSTYLPGANAGLGIDVDATGQAHVTGNTLGSSLPIVNAANPTRLPAGSASAFVTKFSAAGNSLIYSTYINGTSIGYDIEVDAFGNAYVTGHTSFSGFATAGAFQTSLLGGRDAYVVKLSNTGSAITYFTYLGGTDSENMNLRAFIDADDSGSAYVTGTTVSVDFPTTAGAAQTSIGGGGGGFRDAFLTKLSSDGSSLIFSTFLGGSGHDEGTGIGLDSDGSVYSTGRTGSNDFPTTPGAPQPTFGGNRDAWVTKLSADGSTLEYSTYLGGGNEDSGRSIAVDGSKNAYVTGYAISSDFPTVGPFQNLHAGGLFDAFVTKIGEEAAPTSDTTPPRCEVIGVIGGKLNVEVEDGGSGLSEINALLAENATVAIPAFAVGTNGVVTVIGTKIDTGSQARVQIEVFDVAGNRSECDPLLAELDRSPSSPRYSTYEGIPQADRYFTISNTGESIITYALVNVNDRWFIMPTLLPYEIKTIDIGSALVAGAKNTVTVWGGGHGSSVMISDVMPTMTNTFAYPDEPLY